MGMAPESVQVKGGTLMNTTGDGNSSSSATSLKTNICQGNGSDLITVDASLLLALQLPKDRIFILETERMITMFVQNQMLLVHRVARFYGLEHVLDPQRSTVMVLSKTPETQIPIIRLFELVERPSVVPVGLQQVAAGRAPPRILRRNQQQQHQQDEVSPTLSTAPSSDQKKSVEEREEEYSKARAKIFEDFKPPSADEEEEMPAENDVPQVIEPAQQQQQQQPKEPKEKVLFKGWNLAAPEFEPVAVPMTPTPLPRPIYTKPVINFETIPVPQHILLLQVAAPEALKAFVAKAGQVLGATWEIRTKPGHCDALMLCQSQGQAHSILEGVAVVEGVEAKAWKPKYFPEP